MSKRKQRQDRKANMYTYIQKRPFGVAISGCLSIIFVAFLRAAYPFEMFPRLGLDLVSSFGHVMAVMAVAVLAHEHFIRKMRPLTWARFLTLLVLLTSVFAYQYLRLAAEMKVIYEAGGN